MDAQELAWEQELYNEIEYKRKESLFHCFEGDTAFVGLSFMDEIEANHFHDKVSERIQKRKDRAAAAEAEEARRNSRESTPEVTITKSRSNSANRGSGTQKIRERKTLEKEKSTERSSWRPWKKKDKKKRKTKLSPNMIGAPDERSFVHVHSHSGQYKVSAGGISGAKVSTDPVDIDPRIQKAFATMAGGKFDEYLENPEKLQQFQKWAEKEGLYDEIDEIEKIIPSTHKAEKPAKAMPTSGGAPPPPPPIAPPPPPSPVNNSLTPMNRGQSLKVREPKSHGGSNSFLDQIAAGTTLKPVDSRPVSEDQQKQAMGDLLIGAFSKFEEAMRGGSDDGSDSDASYYDSDEWED